MSDCLPDHVMVEGKRYVPEDDGLPDHEKGRLRLTIVDNRGLTFLGRCQLDGEGDWMTIHDAQCVIVWGTPNGGHLAKLANDGPQAGTRFGERASVQVRRSGVVASYPCSPRGW